ncbi:hypothetical protein HYU14_00085 [Candidatus Woesearchaeota archaeon]|nr:hypothetical protein [Candidatus Woesearchaeota archaeon]
MLEQKVLDDGSSLRFERYFLSEESANALGRPVGSPEMQLCLEFPQGGLATPPRASWYLPESFYWGAYERIKAKKDFIEFIDFCLEINSPEDARKAESFLNTLK